MLIQQFAEQNCRDIIERAKFMASTDMFATFPYDEIVQSEDDVNAPPMRVVNTPSSQIPIADILGMGRDEFAKVYPDEESLEAYDKYVAMFIITEGEAVLRQVRDEILRESQRLDSYAPMVGPEEF